MSGSIDPQAVPRSWTARFLDGLAYSFNALEVWARDHACAGIPNQTPSEFAPQIGRHVKRLATPDRDFAKPYTPVAYAGRSPMPENVIFVERLWEPLDAAKGDMKDEYSVAYSDG